MFIFSFLTSQNSEIVGYTYISMVLATVFCLKFSMRFSEFQTKGGLPK
ncbi:hypothetical protein FRC0160_00200 [Corynebacterium diphtheriae]|nr:hypothetical protein FRC0156_00199 [Corynebacterium diphtheriae]CAB0766251.1 hypothetical protein FRC0160_00200 [Corynebacterium diphtheriae]CAB0785636.1 hypothetical protein FRC0210_00197 [Corynebacterium diphtheriae]CAB0847943.1 hypothetical protein FRC0376_00382 [Corynebacterium diphtheriae]CAB1029464.1 hypothetical protein FRC0543_00287 [Corynebacterium diphtheriae]